MNPEMPDEESADKFSRPGPGEPTGSGDGREPEQDDQTPENRFAGIGAGLKGVSQKLLEQLSPDLREKIQEQIRTHGPGSAAVAVNAAAARTRSLKMKLALKGLAKLLKALDSRTPKK